MLRYTGDMGWIPCIVQRDIETLHLYNQLMVMGAERIPQKIMENDAKVNG